MTINFKKLIGGKVRDARLRADLSQSQAAKLLGMERSNLSHIEQGRSRLTLENLVKIPRAYGCKISDLLPDDVVTDYDRQRATDYDLQQIIDAWPKLTEDIRVVLMNQFETLVKLNRSQRK